LPTENPGQLRFAILPRDYSSCEPYPMPECNHVAPAQTHRAFHRPAHAHGTTRDAVRGTVRKEGGTGDQQPPAPRGNSRWRHGASTVLTHFLLRVVHRPLLSASLAPANKCRHASPR